MSIQKQQRRLRQYENKYLPLIYNALNRQGKEFIEAVRTYGVSYAKRRRVNPEPMQRAFKALYKDIILREANTTYDELKRVKRASLGINEKWVQEVKQFLELYLRQGSLVQVDAYSKEVISRILQRGVDEGLGTEEVVKLLRTELETMNRMRALRIVRTEGHRAAMFGHMLGAYDSAYFYTKKWMAVNDNRTRRTHNHNSGIDGEVKDLEKPFSNGLQYPGDPAGSAAETVNCRCVLAFNIKRDANGKPMRKPEVSPVRRQSLVNILWQSFAAGLVSNIVNDLMTSE